MIPMPYKPSEREWQLISAMNQQGYDVCIYATCCRLTQRAIGRWLSAYELPYTFKSINQAAEHLIPIVRDDSYRLVVLGIA